MKKIITFLFIIGWAFVGLGQYADTRIIPYINEFVDSAKEAGVDTSNINKIDYLYVVQHETMEELNNGTPCWGFTKMYTDGTYTVWLSARLLKYIEPILEAVLYHEFFHVTANFKDHCGDKEICHWLMDGTPIDFEQIVTLWNKGGKEELLAHLKWNQENYVQAIPMGIKR